MLPEGVFQHPINKSKKRKLFVSIWDFEASHPQSERKHYLCNDHPAKMRPSLARAILQIYGESPVLDPMSGSGTTCVEASLLGMDSYGVEYERKFVLQARKNIQNLKKLFPDKRLGSAKIIKGDARSLSRIFKRANSIVFSPPYFNAIKKGGEGPNADNDKISYRERISRFQGYSTDKGNIGNTSSYGFFNFLVFSPPYFDAVNSVSVGHQGPELGGLARQHKLAKEGKSGYSCAKWNVSNCKDYGFFGSIVFSPPYCGVMDAKRHTFSGISAREPSLAKTGFYSEDESNLGNVRNYGAFNSIVFSPPYSEGIGHVAGRNASKKFPWRLKLQRKMTETWSKGNVAKLRHGNENLFNSIVFSPPYGEANKGGGIARKGYEGKHGKDVGLKNRCDRPISRDSSNIGNFLYGRTYLGEMFRIYSECYKVLRPGKFMVVVVKDIRRKGLTIPIAADTIKLCQLAGFEVFDIIINKMFFPSFWQLHRAIKDQKEGVQHPLRIHEYVLVFSKQK